MEELLKAVKYMIFETLDFIKDALQRYISEVEQPNTTSSIVILNNIAMAQELGGAGESMDNKVIISLINLEEEKTLKNSSNYRIENKQTIYQNPAVNLNLFVLFSSLNIKHYGDSLKRLARIIEFFQWKKELSFSTNSNPNGVSKEIQIFPDLYSLSFDQLNNLWGLLGGKQVPCVMYRIRLVSLDAQKTLATGVPVMEREI